MTHILYAYIANPTTAQVGSFLRALLERGISISHLGKNDPPRKFGGDVEEAVSMVVTGTDLTNWTFARDAAQRLEFPLAGRSRLGRSLTSQRGVQMSYVPDLSPPNHTLPSATQPPA
jgi:hypothetical protein